MDDSDRPTKRLKLVETSSNKTPGGISQGNSTTTTKKRTKRHFRDGRKDGTKISSTGNNEAVNRDRDQDKLGTRIFSQPSVICTGDKGIFVTSDKGREKQCLLDLNELLSEYLVEAGMDASGNKISPNLSVVEDQGQMQKQGEPEVGQSNIEADIAAEMEELKGAKRESANGSTGHRRVQLITLDIPCVSYLRFPPGSLIDPVDVVHRLCLNASDKTLPQRSRFIKRLTPVSAIGKVLSQGLEKVCDGVLPGHFGPGMDGEVTSVKFAIRPSIRNNDKLHRDEVIQDVANRIQKLGQDKHRVDLKQYEKGVIVEAYRGWIGVSVVENTSSGLYSKSYEDLKRFNLAEIYANR